MKCLINVILFVLVCSCAVSSHRSAQPEAISQLSTGNVADLIHHLAKRQTSQSTQDLIDCAIIATDYQCGSSGYAQLIADIALSCRNESYARGTSRACARNENGDFCGTVPFRFFPTDQTQASTCLEAVTSGSCPSTCRSFLQSVSSRLGCCINTFINTTFNPLVELYRTHVDYHLWSLCNVPLPASDCGNGLPLNPPQDAQDCTLQELYFRLANHLCESNVGQPLVDALLQNSKCYSIARGWVEICSINANKETCAVALGSDVLLSSVDPPDQGDPLVTLLFQNCEESISSTSCNSPCQNAITNIKNSYGCCVSIFNESDSGVQPELSYSFWKSCGVETPGICTTSTLSGAAVMKALVWMIAVAMAIHVALCIH